MLAQTLATGDKFRTEDLALLPAGTAVKMLGSSGWWEITELPQVETLSERDKLALDLREAWHLAFGAIRTLPHTPSAAWLAAADYVVANFTPAETAVAESVDAQGGDAQVVDYPERIRDCDGDLWKLVSSSGRYSWVGALRDEINCTNVSLADLVTEFGPISAE